MASLQSPSETSLPAAARAPADAPVAPADGRSPRTDWPWWSAGLALVTGLLLAALGLLVVAIPAALAGVNIGTSPTPPGVEIADTVVQDVAFIAAALVIAGMGSRRIGSWQFGLRTAPVARSIGLIALLYGSFLIFSAIWATAMHLHGKEKLLDQLGANHSSALLVASALLTCVIAPACEEFLFRGYIFTALRNLAGVLPAALITGVIFGAVHAASAPVQYLVPLAFLGFGLCLLYWRTGSLLPCIAAHSLNNAIAFGALESWTVRQTATLAAAALVTLGILALVLRRSGLILGRAGRPGTPPAPAPA